MLKLIVFDLDNTLAKIGKGITLADIAYLKQIEEQNIKIAICSGKPVIYLCGFMRQVGLKHPILIGENGAVIQFGVDLPPKQYYRLPYSEVAKRTLAFIQKQIDEKLPDVWYQPNMVGVTPFPKSETEFVIIEELLEENKMNLEDVEVYRHADSFDIVPVGIDKRRGLEYLAKLLNISEEEIMAVGDGVNDYPMFEYAGRSIGIHVKEPNRVDENFLTITQALERIVEELYVNSRLSAE